MSDQWSMASDIPAGILLNDTRTVLSRCLQQLDWQQCTANLKLDDSSTETGFQLDPMQHAFMFPFQVNIFFLCASMLCHDLHSYST
jgi:hypothetical protein